MSFSGLGGDERRRDLDSSCAEHTTNVVAFMLLSFVRQYNVKPGCFFCSLPNTTEEFFLKEQKIMSQDQNWYRGRKTS